MKTKLLSLLFFIFSMACFSQVSESYKTALNEMIEISGTQKALLSSVDYMKTIFKNQFPNASEEKWNFVEQYIIEVSIPLLLDQLTPIYQNHLTLEDINSLNDFYHTPTGMKFAEKTPLIAIESMELGQKWGMELGQKLQEILQ